MKKVLVCFFGLVIGIIMIYFSCPQKQEQEYLRIHIRANSNSSVDQDIKYLIKDSVVDALIPLLSECETKAQSEVMLKNNFSFIESVANNILLKNGFNYKAKAKLCNEEFPTRSYSGLTLEQGFYDALILELGSASGDNWWCVVYPPLCFLNGSDKNVVYKSRIMEIIKKVIG